MIYTLHDNASRPILLKLPVMSFTAVTTSYSAVLYYKVPDHEITVFSGLVCSKFSFCKNRDNNKPAICLSIVYLSYGSLFNTVET